MCMYTCTSETELVNVIDLQNDFKKKKEISFVMLNLHNLHVSLELHNLYNYTFKMLVQRKLILKLAVSEPTRIN